MIERCSAGTTQVGAEVAFVHQAFSADVGAVAALARNFGAIHVRWELIFVPNEVLGAKFLVP